MKYRLKIIGGLLILAALVGTLWVVNAMDNQHVSVVGSGRIGDPVPGGVTIPSLSDFGFAVSDDKGTFVCSMAGPETGGFAGFRVMTVEGPVTPGSLQVNGHEITFSGQATIVLIPLGGSGQTILDNVPFSIIARTGKENRAQMILQIPAFTQALGGNTGGILAQGEIRKMGQD